MILKYIFLISVVFSFSVLGRGPIPAKHYQKLSGQESETLSWDQFYSTTIFKYGRSPVKFLSDNVSYIPTRSKVLDMGMGEGRNAVFLGSRGHQVLGVDISSVAINKAKNLAKEFGVKIDFMKKSLNQQSFPKESFDVILCFYFLNRTLVHKMLDWLRPGGLIFMESYTDKQSEKRLDSRLLTKNDYLKPQELLTLFPHTKVLKYEEPLHETTFRASIILKKDN